MNLLIEYYFYTGMLFIIAGLLIHFIIVVPVLRAHGSGCFTGWINLSHLAELNKYKEICMRNGTSLFWYETEIKIYKISFVWMIGLFALFFLADQFQT